MSDFTVKIVNFLYWLIGSKTKYLNSMERKAIAEGQYGELFDKD